MLNKSDILQKTACAVRAEPVPEWGGSVRLRELTVLEQLELQREMRELVKDVPRDGEGKIIAAQIDRKQSRITALKYLAVAMLDDAGHSMFSVEELQSMSRSQEDVLDRLCETVLAVNTLQSDAIEQDAKNSEASPNVT